MEQRGERLAELRRVAVTIMRTNLDGSPDSLFDLGALLALVARTRPHTPSERLSLERSVPEALRPVVNLEAPTLDETTLSFCIDSGIYFGEVLLEEHPRLRWDLWTRRTVEHHRPVLVGFTGEVPCDPVLVCSNMARRSVRGEPQPNALREVYDVWAGDVGRE